MRESYWLGNMVPRGQHQDLSIVHQKVRNVKICGKKCMNSQKRKTFNLSYKEE